MAFNPNFDPIYIALATLIGGCSLDASGVAAGPVVSGVASTDGLQPGLAVVGGNSPVGNYILSVDSPTQYTTVMPMLADGALSLRGGFITQSVDTIRNLRHWADVQQGEQPCFYLTQVGETSTKRLGQPNQWTLDTMLWVYVMAPNDQLPSAPALNTLLGLIRAVLFKDKSGPGSVQNRQMLGGLVLDTWIEGKITTDNGFLGQQAVAKVPVRMIQNGPN